MNFRRLVSLLFSIAAVVGIIFSVVGLIGIWYYRPGVIQTANETLAFLDQTLSTTLDGLTTADKLLQTPAEDMASLESATQALAQTIHDTNPMLDTFISLTSNEFPAAVDATQTSLASSQGSAMLVDNMLAALANIPFLELGKYAPDVPLHTALAQVSSSLDTLKPSLVTINTSLVDGKTNMGTLEIELNKISATIKELRTTLEDAKTVIDQYITVTKQLQVRVEAMHRAAPAWITTISLILSFVLVWLIIVQLGLGMQGFEMLQGRSEICKKGS
jgi:chromosome segregation ATPase